MGSVVPPNNSILGLANRTATACCPHTRWGTAPGSGYQAADIAPFLAMPVVSSATDVRS
jgi:hypothetical protein